jgi:DNA-binding NarL/FixJ family response regulator
MSPGAIITILIADDHPMFRHGLRSVLASEARTRLVGEANTGDEAVRLAEELQPDVIIMDLTMPGLNGVEATRQILARRPETRILVLSMFDDSASVLTAVRAGACGYLVKGADREEVLRAVFAAAAGEAIFGSTAATHVARQLAFPRHNPTVIPGLTNREHEILALMANGYTNAGMSEHLGLTPKTVRNYVSTILAKLGDVDRSAAIERARAAGIGTQDSQV